MGKISAGIAPARGKGQLEVRRWKDGCSLTNDGRGSENSADENTATNERGHLLSARRDEGANLGKE